MENEKTLRAAEEIQALIKKYEFTFPIFGEFFEAFEIATSRAFGQSIPALVKQEELRMIREIHRALVGRLPEQHDELRRHALATVFAHHSGTEQQAMKRLSELLLGDAIPGPGQESDTQPEILAEARND